MRKPCRLNCPGCYACTGRFNMHDHELLRQGGKWLGAARSWLQHKRTTKGISGDQVKWGDVNAIFALSARDVEELAADVAAAAYNEQGELQKRIDDLRIKNLRLQRELGTMTAMWEGLRDVLPPKIEKLKEVLRFCEKKLTDISIAYPSFYVLDALNKVDKALKE